MSGGRLIALAADEIVMCEQAVLGPVDLQLGQYAAASLLKVIKSNPMADVDDETLILADQAEKGIVQLREGVKSLLASRLETEAASELSHVLTEGRWTHDYPIMFGMAQKLGLPVSSSTPDDVLELMALFPQVGSRRLPMNRIRSAKPSWAE
jgi:ClpP class serine protease